MAAAEKSLIIQLARFGDLVQTKRLFMSLAKHSEVHLLIDSSLLQLAKIVYPNAVIHTVTAHKNNGKELSAADFIIKNSKTFSTLKTEKFQHIYNLNFSGLNVAVAGLFPSDNVSGHIYNDGQHCYSKWTALTFRLVKTRRLNINLVDLWAGYAPHMIAPDKVNPEAKAGQGGIGIVMAGRESRRSLPVSVLAKLVNFHIQQGKNITLLGTDSESKAAAKLLAELKPSLKEQVQDMTGKTNWKSLVTHVNELEKIITPDTGTMHLAAHLGTPVTAFFLSSALCYETGPYGKGHTIYQAIQECSPCLESAPCPYEVKCGLPFQDDMFLRSYKNETSNLTGMYCLKSNFDELGCNYTITGGVPEHLHSIETRRCEMRSFISEHLFERFSQSDNSMYEKQPIALNDHNFAQQLYQSSDWMTADIAESLSNKGNNNG